MTLRYIFHSGFLLETERSILIFDYWMDPANVMKPYIDPSGSKHIYVFASHFHEDHFTKEIFKWRQNNPFTAYTYILSKDILKRRRAHREDADVWMAKGSVWEDENIKVTATGSNDSGVSWIVETEGKTIFHAGDLCNWYARFLADGAAEGEIYSEEFGEYINPVAEEKRFLGELKDIHKVVTKREQNQTRFNSAEYEQARPKVKITGTFDLVMFPVDGRIGNGYTLGGRQFIERFNVGMFVPMHFVASGFESAWRMEPFCQEKNIPFWCIKKEGDKMDI